MSDLPFDHSSAFRQRRFLNWFPMGLTYAFLYMGRYNLTVSKNALGDLMTKEDFGVIFAAGTFTYAFAFLLNGPLTDKIGGRKAILIGAFGSAIVNLAMGVYIASLTGGAVCEMGPHLTLVFSILYAVNMYFQSFGAVAIVKVNSHWFHVRERGGFSGIFGTMISSGIFFAFTVNGWVLNLAKGAGSDFTATRWVFFAPAACLLTMAVIETFLLRDKPSEAGHQDFDTGDASSGDESTDTSVFGVIKKIFTNPIIITVALIEFCTGVLRNGVMHWYPIYAKEVLSLPDQHIMRYGSWSEWYFIVPVFVLAALFFFAAAKSDSAKRRGWLFVSGGLLFLAPFLQAGWGGILMVAGVIGGNFAGWVSDLFFQSRRAPTAGLLYGGLSVCAIGMFFTLGTTTNEVAWSKQGHPEVLAQAETIAAAWADKNADAVIAALPEENQTKLSRDAIVETLPESPTPIVAGNARLALNEAGGAAFVPLQQGGELELSLDAQRHITAIAVVPANNEGFHALQPGDQIVSFASADSVENWEDIGQAVACLPATCSCDTQWDVAACTCSSNPKQALTDPSAVSQGTLLATVKRDGRTQTLRLEDPKAEMFAGDQRRLRAGPVLPLSPMWLGFIVFFVSLCVIGTHGLLSGTATMDFGGRKGAATAVGLIDGFVYLGTGVQSLALGYLTTNVGWFAWPIFLFPFGIIGLLLLLRIWTVVPKGKGGH